MSYLPEDLENLILDYVPTTHLSQSSIKEQVQAVYRLTGVRLQRNTPDLLEGVLEALEERDWERLYVINAHRRLGLEPYLYPHRWEILVTRLLTRYYRLESLSHFNLVGVIEQLTALESWLFTPRYKSLLERVGKRVREADEFVEQELRILVTLLPYNDPALNKLQEEEDAYVEEGDVLINRDHQAEVRRIIAYMLLDMWELFLN